jgi:phytoene/squalene synthetase
MSMVLHEIGAPAEAPAARAAFRAGSSTAWPLWLVCPADAYDAFASAWAYFRWADDVVDAPLRVQAEVVRFVADQQALLAGARRARNAPEAALEAALAHPVHGPALACAARGMMGALAWDASRGSEVRSRAELDAQIGRIGDAYALALWTCLGEAGEASWAARELARAATAAHQIRDLHEDLRLGYCNVPAEALDDGIPAWAGRRATELDARFAAGLRGLAGVGWRARFVFVSLGWRYRWGLRQWAARLREAP